MSKLTQADAARLMYAAGKWVNAELDHCAADNPKKYRKLYDAATKAEAAFADLVAQLTDSEGL